jgi:serine O-acetyltransferase
MPHPYGIVIDAESRIGSRVTVMNHVTISAAVIEDNVVIGPGARIIGPLTIGRGAKVGPNAVVTADVPSHATVSDGSHARRVVEERHEIKSAS